MITSVAIAATFINLLWKDDAKVHLTGLHENTDIRLNRCEVTGDDLILRNSDVSMAKCSQDFEDVDMEGGSWRSFPTALDPSQIGNDDAWWSATNGNTTWIGGDHAVVWPKLVPGNNNWVVTVQKDQLKDGLTFDKYKTALWKVRDGAGRVKIVKAEKWVPNVDGKTINVTLNLMEPMKEGPGFWSVTNPNGFTKGIKYNRFNVRGHKYFSVYFADGITVSSSYFGPATKDYNLGFENCINVNLSYLTAWGNQTAQGNGASIAFLYGIQGLKATNIQTDSFQISSQGWPVDLIDVDCKVFWVDEFIKDKVTGNMVINPKAWLDRRKEQGVVKPPVIIPSVPAAA